MTVKELLSRMDSRELSEWVAFNQIDPITQDRGDAQAAIVCQTLANVWRSRGQPALQISQFMPKYGEHKKPNLRQQFKVMCNLRGIKVKGN